jgi:predicted small secreted protein
MKEYTMSRIQHCSRSTIARIAGIVVAFLLLGILLAACGSNITTGGGGQATPTPAQTVNCGKIQSRANGIAPSDKAGAQQAVNCFYQAYQKCQPATLMFSSYGVDTGDVHHFAVKDTNGSCAVSDGFQHFIAPKPLSAITIISCASMSMQSDGLHIESCGNVGTVIIPLT